MSVAPRSILSWRSFDLLLRGRLPSEEHVTLLRTWIVWQVCCAALFGLSLGVYGLTSRAEPDVRFMFASAIKMPLLLLFTSAVTCPSLYVFGALRGLRFSATEFGAMLMVAHTVLAAVLGSLAPVIAFFSLTTESYPFMVLLVVACSALAGGIGIRVFLGAIREPAPRAPRRPDPDAVPMLVQIDEPAARPPSSRTLWQLLGWWVALYVFVGAQMGWMLRPFIGDPGREFSLLRGKGGSLVESVILHVRDLIGS